MGRSLRAHVFSLGTFAGGPESVTSSRMRTKNRGVVRWRAWLIPLKHRACHVDAGEVEGCFALRSLTLCFHGDVTGSTLRPTPSGE